MDQIKIGQFLKRLRTEKSLTQEKLAELIGASNRSVSRWENGNTMPDFDLLIELAKFYDVSIDEIMDGKRKEENMDKQTEETLYKVAEYTNNEKVRLLGRIKYVAWVAVICGIAFLVLEYFGKGDTGIAGFVSGLGFGASIAIALVTTFKMKKLKEFKRKVLKIDV